MTDILRQIQKGIDEYTEKTGSYPDKITLTGGAWHALIEAASHLVIIHADDSPSTLYGYPIEIVDDDPDGCVCVGGNVRRVNRVCNV